LDFVEADDDTAGSKGLAVCCTDIVGGPPFVGVDVACKADDITEPRHKPT